MMFSALPLSLTALSFLSLSLFTVAQDGSVTTPTSSSSAANYHCDTSKCKLPSCNCASTSPPGGLSPSDVPQFLVFTADDAVQSYTIDAINSLLGHRKNPNGCPIVMTYYTSLNYTNYTLVTDWFVAGNEIADHTISHVGSPGLDEINGNLIALNALAGIPLKSIQGFRAPFLNYTIQTLKYLAQTGFTYESSSAASIPVTQEGTDAFWPYTLDYGMANNCLSVQGSCSGQPVLPGFWEIPMYAQFDSAGGIHLMDPWLDPVGDNKVANNTATLEFLKSTFTDHYNAQKQPFGLYTHPIHIANYPGLASPNATVAMINEFLDWAQEQQNVWIVSSEQLLAWVQNPKPISQLDQVDALKCSTPQVNAKICNGMPENEAGLIELCDFPDFPFFTCYGCPSEEITPANPNPPQATSSTPARFRLPSNCLTPFWDPIGNKCLCTESSCAFTDQTRPIGANGANLTGGGTGGDSTTSQSAQSSYLPFNSGSVSLLAISQTTVGLAIVSMSFLFGIAGFLFRV